MEIGFALSVAGLQTAQQALAAVANRIANAETPGYGATRLAVAGGPAWLARPANTVLQKEVLPPDLGEVGGPQVVGTETTFGSGARSAPLATDLAIMGPGFFAVRTPQGQQAYTRVGAFTPDAAGFLTLSDGSRLVPPIHVPANARVQVQSDGTVLAKTPGAQPQRVGQITVARFPNPSGLISMGQGLWRPSPASGTAQTGTPGQARFGSLRAHALNTSGVSLTGTLPDLLRWQTAYGADAQTLKIDQTVAGMLTALPG